MHCTYKMEMSRQTNIILEENVMILLSRHLQSIMQKVAA